MQEIKLSGTIQWCHQNLSPMEFKQNPQVRLFFDNRLIRDPVIHEYNTSVEPLVITGKTIHNTIPDTLHVGVAAFAWRNNEYNAPCLLDIGTNHL